MLKEKKIETVGKLKELFASSGSVFIAHYHGLGVSQINGLRSKMHENKIKFFVAKNSLIKIGIKGTKFEDLDESFSGPTAIVVSDDPILAAKILVKFSSENEQLKLIGAKAFGEQIDYKGIKSLSAMPSLDELRAKLISLIQIPARSLATIMVAPATTMARVVSAYSNKSTQ